VIPSADFLEQHYEKHEVPILESLRKRLERITDEAERSKFGRGALRMLWPSERQYIEKTHFIRSKKGGEVTLLKLNYAQEKLYEVMQKQAAEGLPLRIIILKARQLGFSTFIQSWQYEQCDRQKNHCALTISYDEPSSILLFGKGSFVHDHMWFPREPKKNSANTLEFKDNGGIAMVRTAGNLSAGRGDTYHHLHASEVPMWVDAGETLNSAMQAVPDRPGTSAIYESTAKGAVGVFYDEWGKATRGENDFVPLFVPWFWDPDYSLAFPSPDQADAFGRTLDLTERRLQDAHKLSLEQLRWRRWTIRNKCQGSEAKFRQEYPSTATEAFLTTGSPVFSAEAIAQLEQNAAPPLWVGNVTLELVQ
jgi:hypothetical protein